MGEHCCSFRLRQAAAVCPKSLKPNILPPADLQAYLFSERDARGGAAVPAVPQPDAGAASLAGTSAPASAYAGSSAQSPAATAAAVGQDGGPGLDAAAAWLAQQRAALAALPPTTAAAMCATGAVAGFASGLLGIGGGTVVTPLLALLMPYGQATVLGTSLLAMIPPSLAGLLQHWR